MLREVELAVEEVLHLRRRADVQLIPDDGVEEGLVVLDLRDQVVRERSSLSMIDTDSLVHGAKDGPEKPLLEVVDGALADLIYDTLLGFVDFKSVNAVGAVVSPVLLLRD